MELQVAETELSSIAENMQSEMDPVAQFARKGSSEIRARINQAFPGWKACYYVAPVIK